MKIWRLWVQSWLGAIFYFAPFCQCWQDSARIWQKIANSRKTRLSVTLRRRGIFSHGRQKQRKFRKMAMKWDWHKDEINRQKVSQNRYMIGYVLLPPAYVVRREGNTFTLLVCPQGGVPISHNALQHFPECHGSAGGGYPARSSRGGTLVGGRTLAGGVPWWGGTLAGGVPS